MDAYQGHKWLKMLGPCLTWKFRGLLSPSVRSQDLDADKGSSHSFTYTGVNTRARAELFFSSGLQLSEPAEEKR